MSRRPCTKPTAGHLATCLVAATAIVAVTLPTPAQAGTYTVRQCGNPSAGYAPAADATAFHSGTAYTTLDRCEVDQRALKVENVEPATEQRYGLWRYVAPAGTEITRVMADARFVRERGHVPSLYLTEPGEPAEIVTKGESGGWKSFTWSTAAGSGRSALNARLRCEPTAGDRCSESAATRAWVRNLRITLNDVSSPTLSLAGGLITTGWRSGVQSLAVSAGDIGGGVQRIEIEVNGATADRRVFDCATVGNADDAARMRPCEGSEVASFQLDTDEAPFVEGINSIEVCVEDFGGASVSRSCDERTVRIDNEGPGAPQNLRVVGGDGWRAVNDFDVVWENPEQPAGTAEIDGAYYRIEGEDGTIVEGPTFVPKDLVDALDDRAVPAPGGHRLLVWLRDQAGNADEGDAAEAILRFDDVLPGAVSPSQPAGWLSRREQLGAYSQVWSEPASAPVSGIDGYAVAADRFPTTNPCESVGDPDPSMCVGSELTHPGLENRTLSLSDLPEGSSWIHIAAVSGSGLRSSAVGHVEVKVDGTDPATELLGVSSDWTNQPVTLVARATDALSGMQPLPGDDGEPRTTLRVEGGPAISDPDNEVTHVLSDEGDHEVRYWARDLAGNETDGDPGAPGMPPNGQPGVARVKLDMTPPSVTFQSAEDPADPELIQAPIADPLSGVESGRIEYRAEGETDWEPLATQLSGGVLEARMPSEQLPDGAYELRATALDRAGNDVHTTSRADGSEMVLEVPLKVQTDLHAELGGAPRRVIAYGRESRVRGRLVDAAGRPLPGETVEVTESFDLGAIGSTQTRPVITDAAGRFALVLSAGPSREVDVAFEGSRRYTQAASNDLDLDVRSEARMASSKRRPRVGERFRFVGRVRRRGAALPPEGKLVELQVKRPEGWDTVRQAFRTRASGKWRFKFRFGNYYLRPTTFRFRLKVSGEQGWPYRRATTRARRVTVIPR